MFYALFVTIILSGEITETRWKTFDRFEECWEVAKIVTHNRPYMSARCAMVDSKE